MQALLLHFRVPFIQLSHCAMIVLSLMLSFQLRFDFAIPASDLPLLYSGLVIAVPLKLLVFHVAGLSRGWWKYIGMPDLMRLSLVTLYSSIGFVAFTLAFVGRAFPRSVYCIDLMLCLMMMAALRLMVRFYFESEARGANTNRKRILIYGAGEAAMTLLRETQNSPGLGYDVVGLLDDNPTKGNLSLLGVQVLGQGRDLAAIAGRFQYKNKPLDEVVIAMPSASSDEMQAALQHCRAAQVPSKTVPSMIEILKGAVLTSQIREISIEDLLGREPVDIDEVRVRDALKGATVLVTGATGSIGSELCRQIASFGAAKLIAFDQSESDIFRMDSDMRKAFPDLILEAVVGDIRDPLRLDEVLRQHNIQTIFHAAAYKHVPLMEKYPLEAIRNNVIGTWNLVEAAYRNHIDNFVMISSDKAVRPSSIMGATKRMAELILSAMPQDRTKFVSVRFGNVLGSNGSVVPIFQKQIASGGPVTVTDAEMTRYFMTIPEAARLVLVASTMGKGSEIFVLDMGKPVKIMELAHQMIRLAGKVPNEDIQVNVTGLRPGEKLAEELSSNETAIPTHQKKLLIFVGERAHPRMIEHELPILKRLLDSRDVDGTIAHLMYLVPEFTPDQHWQQRVMRLRASAASASGGQTALL